MSFSEKLGRRAGLLLPLSALRTRRDLGCGDFGDLPILFDWMSRLDLSVLQLLPLNDLAPEESCPYSTLSAFAWDPVYADLDALGPPGGVLPPEDARLAKLCRAQPRALFREIRALKSRALERAWLDFESSGGDRRFEAFLLEEAPWLIAYARFKAAKEAQGWSAWQLWPREASGSSAPLSARARFHAWTQWTLRRQWDAAHALAQRRGVLLFGDLPFGVSLESADAWSGAEDFDFSLGIGAPPDQYSETGQNWDLPAYRWARMEETGQRFWRLRVREEARRYDILRMDHAVGFFRTWLIDPETGRGRFDAEPEAAAARGERFFDMALKEAGPALVVAEDLGFIPPFVRRTLDHLGVPGTKVSRWEKGPEGFLRPKDFPADSVAVSGTHDTAPLASWWDEAPGPEREAYWRMLGGPAPAPSFPEAHPRILDALYAAGSTLLVLPFQDLVGSRERVNTPATVGAHNWTWRMRLPIEDAEADPTLRWAGETLRDLARRHGRDAKTP